MFQVQAFIIFFLIQTYISHYKTEPRPMPFPIFFSRQTSVYKIYILSIEDLIFYARQQASQ